MKNWDFPSGWWKRDIVMKFILRDLQGGEIARFLADHKSDAYTEFLLEKQILLTADTIVWQDGKELGKPGEQGGGH